MKCLILFRHGKSDWGASFAGDHARPLAGRGEKAAKRMGQLLASAGQVPELAITSTAVRARTTLDLAMEAGGWRCERIQSDELYGASTQTVLNYLQTQPNRYDSLMLVGHEPGWSWLVQQFTGGQVRMPTAAMARIDLPVNDWSDVVFGSGELIWLLQPKFFS